MPESIRTRRRWPWVVLATAILLIGGRVAWRFRPLNATERALVGRWANTEAGPGFECGADRRFFPTSAEAGEWSAREGVLSIRHPVAVRELAQMPWQERPSIVFQGFAISQTVPFRWNGPDRIVMDSLGVDTEYVRISP